MRPSSSSGTIRLLLLVSALAALVVVAACGGDADTETVTETETEIQTQTETAVVTETVPPETSPDEEERLAQSCENPEAGYAVRYPEGWHSNPGDVASPCSYFHPEPFEVPEATEALGMAISVSREPVAFNRIAGGDRAIRVVSREETEVDGRRAIARETEATGDALLPAGVRGYQYLVDLDGETLVASTYDVEGLDFERNRSVLDRMAETLALP